MKTLNFNLMRLAMILLLNLGVAFSQPYDMKFTLSDGAQSHQIAFDGLGFLSGNFCACTFVPPGKVADYFGFQYLRDNDITGMGHNSDFSTIIGNNLFYVLTDAQKALVVQTAKDQVDSIKKYAEMRFPLIDAFVRMRDSTMPAGSPGLDVTKVKDYSAKLYKLDGKICIQRARVYASIIKSFTAAQMHYLDSISVLGAKNMPVLPEQIDKKAYNITNNNQFVGAMSIADDIYSWYVGNVDADVYFCPERQANYFGSFYLKDAPAMGNPNYSIDTSLSQSGGARFLAALTTTQASLVTNLLETQRADMNLIEARRTDISNLLRGYISGTTVDTALVLSLSETYGALDGEVSYYYARNFSKVNWTLTQAQKDTLLKIRNLDEYPCNGAYQYSDPITMPTIENTDYLFLPATATRSIVSASASPANAGTVSGADTYLTGELASLTAKAAKNYTFKNWTENGVEVSKELTFQFTVSASRTLVANFVAASSTTTTYSITTSVLPVNAGTVTGMGPISSGAAVTLVATPALGYTFTNWTESGAQVSTSANYSFTANKNRNLVANFTINSYQIVASVSPANSGTITGSGSYNYGASAILTASAASGYVFTKWTEDGNQVSASSTYTFTVSSNKTLVANFQTTTGVSINEGVGELRIYPNPANAELYIVGSAGMAAVTVVDARGNTVLVQTGVTNKFDISTLPSGLYIVQIKDKAGNVAKMFVKQ